MATKESYEEPEKSSKNHKTNRTKKHISNDKEESTTLSTAQKYPFTQNGTNNKYISLSSEAIL